MKLKKIAIAVFIVVMAGTLSVKAGLKKNVITTVHDIGGKGCESCHAPHNGSVTTGLTDQSTGQILLWDRKFTTFATFGTYTSPTMDLTPTEIGGAPVLGSPDPRIYSLLCMSCHDGVTTPSAIDWTKLAQQEFAIGDNNASTSYGLTNDHPVNMTYDPTKDTQKGLDTLANAQAAGLMFWGASNTVQCATCHDPHDPGPDGADFLRVTMTGSGLCLKCHL